ncbi:MAG TPA: ATP-binding protein [Thermoanaerobaculia bacterium]|jgi:hypothetical protein
MSIGPRKKAAIPEWARAAVEESFDEPEPRTVHDHRNAVAWPLFVEAATLTNFVPKDLLPGFLEGDARKHAEKQILRFAEFSEAEGGVRWSLTGAARREVLEACAPGELLQTAASGTSADPVKTALANLVMSGGRIDVASLATKDLEATRIATTWLSGAKVSGPSLADMDRELELRSLLAPFERMTGKQDGGDRFFGRADEIETLRAYVGVVPAARFGQRVARVAQAAIDFVLRRTHEPISVWGTGGVGKTTLIAVFMLEHARAAASQFPFVYLDFDRATVSASNRAALLMEMCRQVGAQFEQLTGKMADLRERLAPLSRATGRSAETDEISRLVPHLRTFRTLIDEAFPSQPFLLVFDTFEVVQYGPDQVAALEEFVRELGIRRDWPRLRVVISGRAEVKSFDGPMQPLELGALDYDSSAQMLETLARDAGKAITYPDAERLITAIVKVVRDRSNSGVRPLRLRILGELFRSATQSGSSLVASLIDEFTNPKSGRKQAGALLFNGIVVRRTIGHVRDADVAALADPGLVVRRITRDVIRDVMTRGTPIPAGSDPGDPETFEPWIVDDKKAQKIFDAFAAEVSLVTREGDALRHRQDVRSDMLPLIRDQRPHAFERLHRLAFEHFLEKITQNPSDAASRGEFVYHGLWLHEDLDQLDRYWPPTDPQIDEREFEPGSEQEIYLRLKRHKDVTPDEMRKMTANVGLSWLAQRGDHLVTELRLTEYVEMIRAIGRSEYEVFDTRADLAAIAARVLYRAGVWREASSLARRHITPPLRLTNEHEVSMLRTWATIAAKSHAGARELDVEHTVAQRIEDPLIRAEVLAHCCIGVSRTADTALENMVPHIRPAQWRRDIRTLRLVIASGVRGTEPLYRLYVEGTRQLPRDWTIATILTRIRGRETKLDEIDDVWNEEKHRYLDSAELRVGLRALAASDHSDWMVPFGNAITRSFSTHGREIEKAALLVSTSHDSINRVLRARDGHSLLQMIVADGVLMRFAEGVAKYAKSYDYPESAPEMAQALVHWHRKTMPKEFAQ